MYEQKVTRGVGQVPRMGMGRPHKLERQSAPLRDKPYFPRMAVK